VLIDENGARAAARDSEARWMKGEPLSPLDGIPTSIKDTTTVRGWPTRLGSHATDETPASEDAPVVARLRGCRPADPRQEHHARVWLESADRFSVARALPATPGTPAIHRAARRAAPRR
jgi:hypothetical protein